jgi:lysophospholipase L1-like esterase
MLAIFGILAGVLVAETGTRLIMPDNDPLWQPHPVLGWTHIPYAERDWDRENDTHVVISSAGYRDRERALEKAPGGFRIGVFGDSQTEAVQVDLDQTFSAVAERLLQKRNASVEVLNFGVSGYSPVQELLSFRENAIKYGLDLAILTVYLNNDVSGVHPALNIGPRGAPTATLLSGALSFDFSAAEDEYRKYHREPKHSLRKYSALYNTIGKAVRETRIGFRTRAKHDGRPAYAGRLDLYRVDAPPMWEEAWTVLEGVLVEFASETDRRNLGLVILSIPAAHVVDLSRWEQRGNNDWTHEYTWDLDGPQNRLSAIAATHGITMLSLVDLFRASTGGEPLYFGEGFGGHLTARGHALIATKLTEFLVDERHLHR